MVFQINCGVTYTHESAPIMKGEQIMVKNKHSFDFKLVVAKSSRSVY